MQQLQLDKERKLAKIIKDDKITYYDIGNRSYTSELSDDAPQV